MGVAGGDGVESVPSTRRPLEQGVQLLAARVAQDLRLAEGSLEGTKGEVVGEVEQRARRVVVGIP